MKIMILLLGMLVLLTVAASSPSPRMTLLGAEDVQHGGSGELYARYLHDNETGQEIVCITAFTHMDGAMSCYLTGRKW